jgi:glutamyl-tRNA reductase
MADLLVEHFQHEQCAGVTVVNRSQERGCRLAEKHGVVRQRWQFLDELIADADIVVGAASETEDYLFDEDRIHPLMTARRQRPLLIIDIAVPRCFDPAVGRLENVYLHSIDDLAQVAQDNIKLRQGDLEQAVEIICESVSAFMDWFLVRDVGPLIGKLKEAFEQIYEIEKERFYANQTEADAPVETSKGRVINKLCRRVIKNINVLSKENGPQEAEQFARSLLADTQQLISGSRSKKKQPL